MVAGQTVEGPMDLTDNDVFLPTAGDYEQIRKEFLVLVARVLVQHVPSLRIFQDVVPTHILHKHSTDTAKASTIVSVWIIYCIIIIIYIYIYTVPAKSLRPPNTICANHKGMAYNFQIVLDIYFKLFRFSV